MYILRLEVKQHVSAYMAIIRFFFFLKVPLYKLRCGDLPSDYNSGMPMYRRILYYIDVYIHIYLLVGGVHPGGVSWMSTSPSSEKKPDDGHIRPKHVVLIQTLEYTSFI